MQQLILRENNIDRIEEESFHVSAYGGCCSYLKYLDLSSNNLVALSNRLFDGLYQLETLNLTDNKFRQIPSPALVPLTQLNYLDLSDNTEIKRVPNSAFFKNTKLTELGLKGCRLAKIENNAFQSLGNVNHHHDIR